MPSDFPTDKITVSYVLLFLSAVVWFCLDVAAFALCSLSSLFLIAALVCSAELYLSLIPLGKTNVSFCSIPRV